jgi:hypothetical protein
MRALLEHYAAGGLGFISRCEQLCKVPFSEGGNVGSIEAILAGLMRR